MTLFDYLPGVSGADRDLALGHLAVHAQTVRVVCAIRDAGIDCVLLKGLGHELWLYPDRARPVSRDVDLLIEPSRLKLACETVLELGMAPAPDPVGPSPARWWHLRFLPVDGSRVPVELHGSFHFLEAPAERSWAVLSSGRERIELGGAMIDVPSVPARALLLALHVAAHGHDGGWAIEDLRRALSVVAFDEWRLAASLAGALDASAAFSSGLRVLPTGVRIADELGVPNPESTARSTFRMLEYATQPPLSGLARLLGAEMIPSPDRMRTWYPLARRGRGGLVAAHAIRLARLGLMSPRLLASWREARGAAGPR
jgi:hypothetical protein